MSALKGTTATEILVAGGEATHFPLLGVPNPPQSSPFLPLQQWQVLASHHNEEAWEEAKLIFAPGRECAPSAGTQTQDNHGLVGSLARKLELGSSFLPF